MITIIWRNPKNDEKRMEIFRSRDKVISTLQTMTYSRELKTYVLVKKVKNKIVSQEVVHGMSYETEDERAILQRFHLVPNKEDYPNGN